MNKGTESSNNLPLKRGRRVGRYLLDKVLPDRTKRLIFFSSFLAHIQICDYSDKSLINRLNLLLNLSKDDSALVFPMHLHNQIWSKLHIDKILEEKGIDITDVNQISKIEFMSPKVRTLSEDIIKVMPDWLRYDSNTRMRSDLIKLFKNIGDLIQKPIIT